MMSVRLFGAVLCGVVYCLAFAPFGWWPLGLLAVCGFFYLLLHTKRPALLAWCFGLGKYGLGASWVYVSINVYGQAAPPLALFLVAVFVCGMALFCLPIGYLAGKAQAQGLSRGLVLATAVVAWVLMDWLLTWLLTGFPWLFLGFAFADVFVGSLAAILGVLGLSALLIASCAAFTYQCCERRLSLYASGVMLLPWLVALAVLPVAWTTSEGTKEVALVQGNLDQAVKWNADQRIPNWRKHMTLTEPHWQADLVVWPEAAITMFPQQAQVLLEQLDAQAVETQTALVVGIPGADVYPDGSYDFKNLGLGLGQAQGRFAKHHLVPFGDYVPLQSVLRGLIAFFDLPMSNAKPGPARQPGIDLGFSRTALAICYEIAYGESMRQRALNTGLLMTISNDTWFGASIGPHQHMQIAQMRARENGRWLVRATNNGVTAIVDDQGQIAARLPQFVAQTLTGTVHIMQGRTPYSVVGDWPLLACLLAAGVFLLWRYRQAPED